MNPPVFKVISKALSSTRDCNEMKGEICRDDFCVLRIQTIYNSLKHVSTFLTVEFRLRSMMENFK